jgi:hypothetical protein
MAQVSSRPQDASIDTWIQTMPLPSSDDRRTSARVPTALKVRLGPAREPPSTTLLCEDVSEGGLFVRCGQAVQVGARFSVELTLVDGQLLYIPEAEVLYNTGVQGERRGFGARFVAVTREAQQKLLELARFGSDIQPRGPVSGSMIVGSNDRATSRMRRVPGDATRAAGAETTRPEGLRAETTRPELALRMEQAVHDGGEREVADTVPRAQHPSERPTSAEVAPAAVLARAVKAEALPRVSDLRVASLRPGVGLVVPMPARVELDDGEVHGALPLALPADSERPAMGGDVHDTLLPHGGFTALGVRSDLPEAADFVSTPPLADEDGAQSFVDGGTLPPLSQDLEDERAPQATRSGVPGGWIMGAGAVVAGVLLAVYLGGKNSPADAQATDRIPGRVSGSIAESLTAPRAGLAAAPTPSPAPAVASAAPAAGGALSKLDAQVSPASPAVAKPEAAKVAVSKPEVAKVAAPKAEVTKPEAAKIAAAKPEAAKAAGPKAEVVKPEAAKVAAAKPEVVRVEPSKAEAPKTAAAKAPAAKPEAAASDDSAHLDAALARLGPKAAPSRGTPAEGRVAASVKVSPVVLAVAAGSKVLRTHVLREPSRFVVDLETSGLPTVQGGQARVGKHQGFVRVVVDAPQALGDGTAKISGERLTITLAPR